MGSIREKRNAHADGAFERGVASVRPRQGNMNKRSIAAIESEIATAIVRFQREQQGRGASGVHVILLGDIILVRSTGIFTPTEARLVATEDGQRLIRHSRHELRLINHAEIERVISEIVESPVLRSYCDVNVEAAEQMEVYVLKEDVVKSLLRQDLDRWSDPPRRGG